MHPETKVVVRGDRLPGLSVGIILAEHMQEPILQNGGVETELLSAGCPLQSLPA